MRKLVLEKDCPGQQIFPGEEGAIFRGAHSELWDSGLAKEIP